MMAAGLGESLGGREVAVESCRFDRRLTEAVRSWRQRAGSAGKPEVLRSASLNMTGLFFRCLSAESRWPTGGDRVVL